MGRRHGGATPCSKVLPSAAVAAVAWGCIIPDRTAATLSMSVAPTSISMAGRAVRRCALWVSTPRLHHPQVLKARRSRSQNLAHRVPRYLQLVADRLDRLAFDKVVPPDPPDRLHYQHPPPPARIPSRAACTSLRKGGQSWTPITPLLGSIFGSDSLSVQLALRWGKKSSAE